MKKAFSLVEISIVLVIIAAIFFTVLPISVSNIKQAHFITEWKDYIEQVKYSFETLIEYKKINKLNAKESVRRLITYMDGKPNTNSLKNYKYKMMNGKFYQNMNLEKFDEIYVDTKNRLIGVEYGELNCKKLPDSPCATVWIDLNGVKKPNIVGKDIFVYEIYSKGIEPYGQGINLKSLKADCSKSGTGMSCSRFYLLGGDLK